MEIFKTSSPGIASQVTLRELLWGEWGEEPAYIEVLQQRAGSLNIKMLLLLKKKIRYPKLRNLALFSVWENARVLLFGCSVVSNPLQLHGLQHTKLPCPSPSLGVCSNSGRWCHPTISSSAVPFSSCLQSFPASGFSHNARVWAHGNHSFHIHLSYPGPVSCVFSHLEITWGSP